MLIGSEVYHPEFEIGHVLWSNGIVIVVEFENPSPNLSDGNHIPGNNKGKPDHCLWCTYDELRLISHPSSAAINN